MGSRITIGKLGADPGQKVFDYLVVGQRPGGGNLHIPVVIVNGTEKGPVFLEVGGAHGNETEGIRAVALVTESLDPKKLRGTYIGVPVLNVPAFELDMRGLMLWGPDPVDANRLFPGKTTSGITSYIVHTFTNQIMLKAEYVVAHHGGPLPCFLAPRVIINRKFPKAFELGKAMGAKWDVLQLPQHSGEGTLEDVCEERGITSITIEYGGGGSRAPEAFNENAQLHASAVLNGMKHLGLIDGKPDRPSRWDVIERDDPRSREGGLTICEPAFRLKNKVKKGTPLMKVVDVFGRELETILAPSDGIVMGLKTEPVTYPAERIIWFGRIVDTIF